MLGSLILYLKGMRIMMFQLFGFYCIRFWADAFRRQFQASAPKGKPCGTLTEPQGPKP